MFKLSRILLSSIALAMSVTVVADELAGLKKMLTEKIPGVKPDSITKTPIPNLYEIVYGTHVFYSTKDGQFAVEGDLLDLNQRVNLTEAKRSAERLKIIKKVPQDTMIVFSPKQVKHTLTVFTDIDCGFCRKLHREMTAMQKHGIQVRYLFYPQTGVATPSYDKAVTVWCAKDRPAALTAAKLGEPQKPATCANPIQQHMKLARDLDIQGTPMLLLEDGEILEGFGSIDELIKILEPTKSQG